jgi:hypothetical protein
LLILIGAVIGIVLFETFLPSSEECPSDGSVSRAVLSLWHPRPQYGHQQSEIRLEASSRQLFRKLPTAHEKSYIILQEDCKICHQNIRALRELGWKKVDDMREARLVHTTTNKNLYSSVESWQRYNHFANTTSFSRRSNYIDGWRRYMLPGKVRAEPRKTYFLPEFYRLHHPLDRELLKERLSRRGGGKRFPWIMNSKNLGVNLLNRKSRDLNKVLDLKPHGKDDKTWIQKHICNQLEWEREENMVVRIFWMVASSKPLMVFYQDGFVRTGYDTRHIANQYTDKRNVPWSEFEEFLADYANKARRRLLDHVIRDPVVHVRNQFKEAISTFVDAFRDYTFQVHSSEDAYEIFAADFAVDKDLDVWLLQIYKDTVAYGDAYDLMLGDYYFLLEKSHQMFYGAYLTLIEIWNKQQAGMEILPLENTGMWELIVADPWSYVNEGYKRRKKPRTCKVRKSKYDHEYLVDDPQRETDPPLLQF